MTPQRWLILASHIPAEGGLGGMIRYTVEMTRALVAIDGIDVYVYCTPAAAPFFAAEIGVHEQRIIATAAGSTVRDSLTEVFGLGPTIRENAIDVVLGSKQLLPLKSYGALRVLAVHDMLPLDRPEDFGLLKRYLLPPAYRQAIRRAELVVSVSEAARQQVARYEPAAAATATVIANAMTDVLRRAELEPVPELLDRPFALCVGDQSPRKNAIFLVRLWPEVLARIPDAHLALVGPPGWGRNEHLPGLDEMISAGSISHLGRISDGALRWSYENARLTLCPSLLEGFGLPVVEALRLGSPTVISADPAQVEASEGAACVIPVTEPERWVDAIVDHFESPRCGLAGIRNRMWDQVATELVELVSSTIDGPIGRTAPSNL